MINSLIIIDSFEQGSPEWLAARIGCITMSNAGKLLTGGKGVTRRSYIIDVASEILSGRPADRVSTWDMERGILLEEYARRAYEARTGLEVRQVGFGYLNENRRISASPDGLTINGGVEIKCQAPKAHLKTIIDAKTPSKFKPQLQGGMWVFGVNNWDYCSFCPEFEKMPLFILSMERDDEMISKIEESALSAVDEVDEYVRMASGGGICNKIDLIRKEALELIDIIQGKDVEIE